MRSKNQCSVCPAIHTKSRSWLRSSSTREPSDPPLRVVKSSLFNSVQYNQGFRHVASPCVWFRKAPFCARSSSLRFFDSRVSKQLVAYRRTTPCYLRVAFAANPASCPCVRASLHSVCTRISCRTKMQWSHSRLHTRGGVACPLPRLFLFLRALEAGFPCQPPPDPCASCARSQCSTKIEKKPQGHERARAAVESFTATRPRVGSRPHRRVSLQSSVGLSN